MAARWQTGTWTRAKETPEVDPGAGLKPGVQVSLDEIRACEFRTMLILGEELGRLARKQAEADCR